MGSIKKKTNLYVYTIKFSCVHVDGITNKWSIVK